MLSGPGAVPVADLERRGPVGHGSRAGARPLLPDRRLRGKAELGFGQQGPGAALPDSDESLAGVRAVASRRDPGAARSRDPQHPPADLEPAYRPQQAPAAGELLAQVRRDLEAAEHEAARAEQHRQRPHAAGHGPRAARVAAARGSDGEEARSRALRLRGHRQLADAELRPQGAEDQQANERQGEADALPGR